MYNFFEKFNQNIFNVAQKHNPIIKYLSNEALCLQIGKPDICLISGLHGDEKSGPLAILEFLKKDNLNNLIIFPLVNDVGWNTNKRNWNDINLNRCFGKDYAPPFIKEICKIKPKHIIDLHEDSETDYPFVFQYINNSPDLLEPLIYKFNLEMEIYEDGSIWDGSTETFFMLEKGINCITLEVPPTIWSIEKRILFQVEELDFCITNIFNQGIFK